MQEVGSRRSEVGRSVFSFQAAPGRLKPELQRCAAAHLPLGRNGDVRRSLSTLRLPKVNVAEEAIGPRCCTIIADKNRKFGPKRLPSQRHFGRTASRASGPRPLASILPASGLLAVA
jgi:hypothetical protein